MTTICLGANTLRYPHGGGHQWVFLNWALGFVAAGCQVIWLEEYGEGEPVDEVWKRLRVLKANLRPFGLDERIAIFSGWGESLPPGEAAGCLSLEEAMDADLLLNASYRVHPEVIRRFRRSALLDIDPGLLQRWLSRTEIAAATYDLYFTIGETVGQPGARFPDAGVRWIYTPPAVALDAWPVSRAPEDAPFTTVSHWYMHEWVEDDAGRVYENNKRSGFVPYFDLPSRVSLPLELALCLGPGDEAEQARLEGKGWSIRHAHDVASTPEQYRSYIRRSRGEFSGVKPSCVHLQNAWISDRTLCFLASGKPAVVQHTGPSRFLPDREGLFRFRDLDEAVECLEMVANDYDAQCAHSRALAEEFFDARVVAERVLEHALA